MTAKLTSFSYNVGTIYNGFFFFFFFFNRQVYQTPQRPFQPPPSTTG